MIRKCFATGQTVIMIIPLNLLSNYLFNRYNTSPGHWSAVYRQEVHSEEGQSDSSAADDFFVDYMKWGLETSTMISNSFSTFNCRSESLSKPVGLWAPFRNSHRCIVFAEGYYEWLKSPTGNKKTPYYVKRRDSQMLCLAGLWNKVKRGEKSWYTFTIVTTSASDDLKWLHDRMPVMISDVSSMSKWIDLKTKWSGDLLSSIGKLQTKDELEWYEVSPEVGKVKNNNSSLNKPFQAKKQSISQFFRPKDKPESAKTSANPEQSLESNEQAPEVDSNQPVDQPQKRKQSSEVSTPGTTAMSPKKKPKTSTDKTPKITNFFARK